jgi:S-adenosylmethionine hydrolase
VFAPAAAHLANGVPIADLGPAVAPDELVRVSIPAPELGRALVSATVLAVDRFGNVATNLRREHLDQLGLSTGDRVEVRLTFDRYYAVVADTFADAPTGELILYEDSYGYVTIAISQGNAARLAGVHAGDAVRVAVA